MHWSPVAQVLSARHFSPCVPSPVAPVAVAGGAMVAAVARSGGATVAAVLDFAGGWLHASARTKGIARKAARMTALYTAPRLFADKAIRYRQRMRTRMRPADCLLALCLLACGCVTTLEADGGLDSGVALADATAPEDLAPEPTRKLASGAYALAGVTSDDQVIMLDPVKNGAFAVPIKGGAPQVIDPTAVIATIDGRFVFTWSNIDQNGIGDVRGWTAAWGSNPLGSGSSARLAAGSADGTRFVISSGGNAWGAYVISMTTGHLFRDASAVVYQSGGALGRIDLPSQSPKPLVASGVDILKGFSPDDQWLLYSSHSGLPGKSDLFLTSTTTGLTTTLSSKLKAGLRDDFFTADSTRALYLTDVMASSAGTLFSQPVSGGPPIQQVSSVWNVRATRGAQVVFNDHYHPALQSRGRADLQVVDTAKPDSPIPIATGAEVDFYLSTARDKAVYSYQAEPGKEGVYVTGIPR